MSDARLRLSGNRLLWAIAIGVFVFLYSPVLTVVVFSFNSAPAVGLPLEHLNLRWYWELVANREIIASLLNSLSVAAWTVAISIGFGIPAAFALDRLRFPGKAVFERIVLLPLILPGIITGVSLLSFFVSLRLQLSLTTVILGHGTALISVVVTQVYARLRRMERHLEEAAMDLGAAPWRTFWHVTLPNIRTAVIGAALLVFTLSMDEIAVSFFLIGRENTLPLQIWSMLRQGITPEVNAISTVVFVMSAGAIVLWHWLTRSAREEHELI